MKKFIALIFLFTAQSIAIAQVPNTVFLEELTWTEVREAIDSGTTSIIIPTGG
jgi:creatinine amidohydrolase